jgi:hypothetical protein
MGYALPQWTAMKEGLPGGTFSVSPRRLTFIAVRSGRELGLVETPALSKEQSRVGSGRVPATAQIRGMKLLLEGLGLVRWPG